MIIWLLYTPSSHSVQLSGLSSMVLPFILFSILLGLALPPLCKEPLLLLF